MTTAYKTLGQVAPAAATLTTLYAAPGATSAICSTLSVCNQSDVSTSVRIAVRPAGAVIAAKHYVVYDAFVDGNDTLFLTLGITLAATDVVSVYAGDATVSFCLFGSELT